MVSVSETRTFKNPWHISHGCDWIQVYKSENQHDPSGEFNESEWDWAITFTRKAKPIEVGSAVRELGGSCRRGQVKAEDGRRAWVHFFHDHLGNTINAEALIRLSLLEKIDG